jgi:mannose-6-phosphate isomerase-like protein (cupin superfamily)
MEKINTMDNNYGINSIPETYKPFSPLKKYWGEITTLISTEDYCLKRIFMKKDSQSSLEFHVNKKESYYIESGKLKIGFRIGRAINKSKIINKGEVIHINPGLMHMRIALEDTVIIEVSTKDSDSDSHLVEDGKKYKFKEDK